MGKTDDLGTLRGWEIIERDAVVIPIEGEWHEVIILDVVDEADLKVEAFSHTDNHVYKNVILDIDDEYEVWGS